MSVEASTDQPTRILLVEDDNHIGRIIELALPELNIPYAFEAVISAEEGLELWKRQPFDVLVTDYNLRGMNGIRLVDELRSLGFNPPILLVTAYDSAELRRDARSHNIDAYLTKPFFMDELVDTVRRLLPAPTAREVNGG